MGLRGGPNNKAAGAKKEESRGVEVDCDTASAAVVEVSGEVGMKKGGGEQGTILGRCS